MRLSLVSVRIGAESDGIYDSLIVHELVKLGLVNGEYFVVFWIPYNLVRFMDLGLTWFLEWLLDFVPDILSHDSIIQLALAFTVESETSHLALYVSLLGGVAIILGATRHEFHNVVILFQFTRELA